MQQSSNSIHKKRSSDNIVCDNKILCGTSVKESSKSDKEQINVSECKDTSFNSMSLEQDLSDSPVPCSDLNMCDDFGQSWTAIYPSEMKTTSNDSDASLPNAICTNIEQTNYRKSDARNNVCKNNNGYIGCHAVDGSRWLPKSIYTDCTHGKVPKERFAETKINGCKYRNKRLQDSTLNRNNVLKRQMEHKSLQRSSKSCQKDHAARQRSRCSCITEEEEDCFTNIDKIERKLPENVYDNTKCLEKISVCRASNKLAESAIDISFNTCRERVEQTCEDIFEASECLKGKCNNNIKMSVCQTASSELSRDATTCQASSSELNRDATTCEAVSFSVARERFEKMQTCKSTFENSMKRLKGIPMYETTFGNSEELPKLTRVCKEFVTEESQEDITVCKRMFGEPKRSSEEVIVCEALPDAEEAPKETICKKISDSNFVNQNNGKKVFLNDTKDNLVKESTSGSNLNIQKTNSENATRIVLDNNVALNNFAKQNSVDDAKQDEQIKETLSSNLPKILTIPVGPNKDSFSQPSSKIIYSTPFSHTQFNNRSNLAANLNEKEAWKTFVNKRKMARMNLSLNQSMRNNFQQLNKNSTARDPVSDKIDQSREKTQEELDKEEQRQDISREKRTTEEIPRDSLLNRSVKKLIDVIKLGRMKIKERAETEKDKLEKIISDDIKAIGKSDIVFKNKGKFNDAIDSQKLSEKMTPMKYPPTRKL